ncbi:MAG: NAD(P)H-dependent oxidoreductase [Blastochloris sp.]|nr:NAD(P)H-dependent oxidoreductase [Blastochloris sp.]
MAIQIISGTNRPGSATRKIAGIIQTLHEKLGHDVALLDLAELPAELFSPASYAEKPAAFQRFADAVVGAEGLVVVMPEYNGGIPGILKYFIDMLPFPESFENKPVCFVGVAAGMWGGLRPVEQAQMIFAYRNAFLYPNRVFLSGIYQLLDEERNLKDESLVGRLQEQARGFAVFCRNNQSKGSSV